MPMICITENTNYYQFSIAESNLIINFVSLTISEYMCSQKNQKWNWFLDDNNRWYMVIIIVIITIIINIWNHVNFQARYKIELIFIWRKLDYNEHLLSEGKGIKGNICKSVIFIHIYDNIANALTSLMCHVSRIFVTAKFSIFLFNRGYKYHEP